MVVVYPAGLGQHLVDGEAARGAGELLDIRGGFPRELDAVGVATGNGQQFGDQPVAVSPAGHLRLALVASEGAHGALTSSGSASASRRATPASPDSCWRSRVTGVSNLW